MPHACNAAMQAEDGGIVDLPSENIALRIIYCRPSTRIG